MFKLIECWILSRICEPENWLSQNRNVHRNSQEVNLNHVSYANFLCIIVSNVDLDFCLDLVCSALNIAESSF